MPEVWSTPVYHLRYLTSEDVPYEEVQYQNHQAAERDAGRRRASAAGYTDAKGSRVVIAKEHINFIRAVAKLAREHGVNHVDMSFDLASSRNFLAEHSTYNRTRVKAAWCEGRHGTTGGIDVSSEDSIRVSENPEDDVKAGGA